MQNFGYKNLELGTSRCESLNGMSVFILSPEFANSWLQCAVRSRVADPTLKRKPDPDPTFKRKPDPDPTLKRKPDPDPTLKRKPDPDPTLKRKPDPYPTLKRKPDLDPTLKRTKSNFQEKSGFVKKDLDELNFIFRYFFINTVEKILNICYIHSPLKFLTQKIKK